MIHSLRANWRHIKPQPQTYILLGSLSFTYLIFIYSLGFHPLALIAGLAIALITWSIWTIAIPPKIEEINQQNQANLLLEASFENELRRCERQLEQVGDRLLKAQWQDSLDLARNIHTVTQQINERHGSFLTELLEILHLVLSICREIAGCTLASTTVKNTFGLQQVARRLELKQSQLQEIDRGVSELRDKLIVSDLSANNIVDPDHLKQLLKVLKM